MSRRLLIVNADDFGRTEAINTGVIEAFERGIVTSTSLMVNWPAADAAAEYAARAPKLSVGLHVDIGEWRQEDGRWWPIYTVAGDSAAEVEEQLAAQLDLFRMLVGRGPTHLDSHQHVHMREPAQSVLRRKARELGISLRGHDVRYCGAFYGQQHDNRPHPHGVTVEHLIDIIVGLPPGVTELGCHPAGAGTVPPPYVDERRRELDALCSERVRAAIDAAHVELISFADLTLK